MTPERRSKIKSPAELVKLIKQFKIYGKKIVLSHGSFDVIHHGHLCYLNEAKKLGDIHIVSVVSDRFIKKGLVQPIFNQKIRANSIASLESVDFVVSCDNIGPWDLIRCLKPDVYVKGEDSAVQLENPKSGVSRDKQAIESVGGIFSITKAIPIHSIDISNSFNGGLSREANDFIDSLRRKYNAADIITEIEKLKKMKVLVIGETIIDEYRYMAPLGKPAKSHVVSAQYLQKEEFAGGISACANHIAGIVGQVDLVTYLGSDNPRESFIRGKLKPNVKPMFFYCPGQPTIIKRRFVDHAYYSKFFEEYEFNKNYLPLNVEKKVADFLNKKIKDYDLVLVVDYGHGFLSKKLIDIIVSKANFLAVNTQTNSGNAGFNYITKYPRADYICIDEMESRLALQDEVSGIDEILKKLYKKHGTKYMVITMAKSGAMSYDGNGTLKTVPSFATKITDTVGSGDAFLSISAPCAAFGFPIDFISFIGSLASAVAVDIIGNKSAVEREEIFRRIGYLLD